MQRTDSDRQIQILRNMMEKECEQREYTGQVEIRRVTWKDDSVDLYMQYEENDALEVVYPVTVCHDQKLKNIVDRSWKQV